MTNDGQQVCGGTIANRAAVFDAAGNNVALASRVAVVDAAGNRAVLAADAGTIIGSRPSGCPHSYCGCGLRMYLGLSDLDLTWHPTGRGCFHTKALRAPGSPPFAVAT